MSEPGKRILIVDDEQLNVDLLEQELGDLGFETRSAYGGREALKMVAADPPDLILLDVMMPDLDGIAVCRRLKDDPATRLIPIVIMTSLDAVEDRVRGIEAGADDFLTKPVDDRELLARINTALKTKQAVDAAIDELESASAQLDRLGFHEEDLSVLVIELRANPAAPVPDEYQATAGRYRASVEDILVNFAGEVVRSHDSTITAVMRGADHTRIAYEAAQAIRAEVQVRNRRKTAERFEVAIAIDAGSASVGSQRIVLADSHRWALAVKGRLLDGARRRAQQAQAGVIEISADAQARLPHVPDPDTGEHTPDGLPWPAQYAEFREFLALEWEVRDLYLHRVLSGKSGALVYAVDITTHGFGGQAILKLTDHSDQTYEEEDESQRHAAAFKANPSFAESHFPKMVHTAARGPQTAILSTIAARGLEYSLPWAHCAYDVQVESGARLARELLEEWNSSYRLVDGVLPPRALLEDWLDYRVRPQDGGRIHGLLSNVCGLDPLGPTFLLQGHWYPNPLAFTLDSNPGHESLSLRAMRGNYHGDLHGYNLLVSGETEPHAYYVIDLADFRPDSFLFFDHGYFELSHLLSQRQAATFEDWIALLDAIDRGIPPRSDDLGLVQLVHAMRDEIAKWIDRYEPNRLAYLDKQTRLGRIAAGLNFSHKRMDVHGRILGLLYAAHNLKGYLKFQGIDWPRSGEVLQIEPQRAS